MASLIHRVAHGLSSGDAFYFGNIIPTDAGVVEGATYYVHPTGLTADDFQFSETNPSGLGTFTVTIASPAVFTRVAHGLTAGNPIVFSTTGSLPTGLTAGTTYYVIEAGLTDDAFEVSDTPNGAAINTSGGQAGTHTVAAVAFTLTFDITSGIVSEIAVYTPVTDPDDVHAPPPFSIAHMLGSPTDLVPNASLEFDTADPPVGWGVMPGHVIVGNVGSDFDISSAVARTGTKSLMHTQPNPVANNSRDCWPFPVVGSRRYRWSFWFRGDAANGATARARLNIVTFDAAGTQLTNSAVYNVANSPGNSTTWVQASGTFVADATAVYATVRPNVTTTGATVGDKIYWDDFEVYPSDYDVDHASGNVIIDSTGITINNGKLTLKDEFGASSLFASGFSGSWFDFIATGLYNGSFRAGVDGTIGNGRTVALPYWTVSDVDAGGTLTFLNPGLEFKWGAAGDKKKVLSDVVPIIPGTTYEVVVAYDVVRLGGSVVIEIERTTWDETLTFSTTLVELTATHALTASFMVKKTRFTAGTGDYFAQVAVKGSEITTHHSSNRLNVHGIKLIPVGGQEPIQIVYTVSSTWLKPDNLSYLEVECIGGGGGSGSAASTSSTQAAAGSGGGGGGYAKIRMLAALLPDSCAVTVGAGGTGATSGSDNATAGGNSTFAGGSYGNIVGNGGGAGARQAASNGPTRTAGGSGGSASGGQLNISGSDGDDGFTVNAYNGTAQEGQAIGAGGGASHMSPRTGGRHSSGAGIAGKNYGGGAAGGFNANSQGAGVAGADGDDGLIIVTEYYI